MGPAVYGVPIKLRGLDSNQRPPGYELLPRPRTIFTNCSFIYSALGPALEMSPENCDWLNKIIVFGPKVQMF